MHTRVTVCVLGTHWHCRDTVWVEISFLLTLVELCWVCLWREADWACWMTEAWIWWEGCFSGPWAQVCHLHNKINNITAVFGFSKRDDETKKTPNSLTFHLCWAASIHCRDFSPRWTGNVDIKTNLLIFFQCAQKKNPNRILCKSGILFFLK